MFLRNRKNSLATNEKVFAKNVDFEEIKFKQDF